MRYHSGCIILFLSLLSMAAQAQKPAQLTEKATLHLQQTNMLSVIRELDRQSAYTFTYDERSLQSIAVAEIQFDNTPLSDVLSVLRREYHLVFSIREQNISVKPEPAAPVAIGPQAPPYILSGQVKDL